MKRTMKLLISLLLLATMAACSTDIEVTDQTIEVEETETPVTTSDSTNTEYEINENEEVINLESIDFSDDMGLYEAIETRVAARNFTDKEISFDVVAKILWASHGVTYTGGDRTEHGLDIVTSATEVPRYVINPASYERYIRIYYISRDGAFEYVPEDNTLVKRTDADLMDAGTTTGNNKQFRILMTMDKDIYNFDEKWGYLAVGSSIQNVNLVANSENVHVLTEGMFNKESFTDGLNLKDAEEQVILLSFGYIE